MRDSTFLKAVQISNFKSIAKCRIDLGPLTFLVGPNGSGKSNFLDALRFVADSLRYSLEHAMRERGGIGEVRRRSGGHPTHFGIRLDFELEEGRSGYYGFRVGAQPGGGFDVQEEECVVRTAGFSGPDARFQVRRGEVTMSVSGAPPARSSDRLYLVAVSGLEEFRPLYDALSRMGFYNLNPERMRELQAPDPGELLARDGGNLASLLAQLQQRHPEAQARVVEYLGKIVPGIEAVDLKSLGPRQTLEFKQRSASGSGSWRFLAANMSDGTLRVLGVLVALFQGIPNGGRPQVRLVGIEEPEAALHPGAAGVLFDSLNDASRHVQVLVTSHSADLLDHDGVPAGAIRAVQSVEGVTQIEQIDARGRDALKNRLFTAGELLRQDQLRPDPEALARLKPQFELFGKPEN